MPERWQRELEKWGDVQAPERMRARVDDGAKGDGMPPNPSRGQRVLAGVVAFAVFGVAAALALGAFGNDTPVPIAVGPTPAVVFSLSGDETGAEATMTVDGRTVDGYGSSYCWQQTTAHMCGDVGPPTWTPSDIVTVEAGSLFDIQGNADTVDASLQGYPFDASSKAKPIPLDGTTGRIPSTLGLSIVTVSGTWSRGSRQFFFPVNVVPAPAPADVLVATSTKPADGSQPSLDLTYGDTSASIHAQGGTWPDTGPAYTAEMQSLPGDVLPGTTIAFKGDWDGLSADIRYGMPVDSPTQPLSLSANEVAGRTGATATLPEVPGRYVILVHAGWNFGTGGATELGTAEFTFLVTIGDPADLVVWVDGQSPEPPYVHARFGDQDLPLVPSATGPQPSQELPERVTVPEGTSMWVVGEATEIQAVLDATFADTHRRFDAVTTPGGPAAVLDAAPAGTWVLRVPLRWDGGESTFLLRVDVTAASTPPTVTPTPGEAPLGSVTVPDVTGMTEADARSSLAEVGLTLLPAYFFSDTVADGLVIDTTPEPGTKVAATTAVEVHIAAPGSPPPNGGGWVWLGQLQEAHPELIVGAARGPDGNPVIALNPGVDPATATPILDVALDGKPYSTISCPRSKSDLDAVGREMQRLTESKRLPTNGWGGWVDALSCTYVVEGSFPADSVAQMRGSFGDAITIVDGVRMSLG